MLTDVGPANCRPFLLCLLDIWRFSFIIFRLWLVKMDIELFNYELPEGYIAYFPAARRDASKLMVLDRTSGQTSHHSFRDITDFLKAGDALVINNTKVFKARFLARRGSGGKVEVFLLEETKFEGKNCWKVLTHPTRRVKEGETIYLDGEEAFQLIKKYEDGKSLIKFKSRTEAERIIKRYGHMPLPVYIHRPDRKSDEDRYQTVYAHPKKAKSVAAPTAGLHFTKSILQKIKDMGVKIIPITLHVGLGTFKTVRAVNIGDHIVDPEYAEISKSAVRSINKVRRDGGRIFAVGTTSVRTLESAEIADNEVMPFSGFVDLYIRPGYQFKIVDHLITNFHLPKSSLIILVSAFAGREKILKAYSEAIQNKYRFYSYGDCMLIL